jgi:hypothetical protein
MLNSSTAEVNAMIIAASYSIKDGEAVIRSKNPAAVDEIKRVITSLDASSHRMPTKQRKRKFGQTLYDPASLRKALAAELEDKNWRSFALSSGPVERKIDFVKSEIGLEVQFGKPVLPICSVCAQMTIFQKMGVIEAGVEIVPVKDFADEMSTGVSYFEQFVWDLEHRGLADIDIPVLILGVTTQ